MGSICCNGGPQSWSYVKMAISAAQLALTATILLLVRYKLRGMAAVPVDGQLTWASTCYLAAVSDWPEACTYADVVACVSLLLMFILSVVQCCTTSKTSSRKQCPRYLQLSQAALLLLSLLWWAAAACTLQYFSSRANSAGLERAGQRTAVSACSWACTGLFAVLLAGELLQQAPLQRSTAVAATAAAGPSPPSGTVFSMGVPMRHLTASPPAAGASFTAAAVPLTGHAAAPANLVSLVAGQQSIQRVQPSGGFVVTGIPCAPAAPVPPVLPPRVPPTAAASGWGPGSYQMAMLGWGSSGRPHSQILPVSSQPAWSNPARTASAPGRVLVVNPDV